MPISPLFVQQVSEKTVPTVEGHKFEGAKFTNTSSQQMTPGQLLSFFANNNQGKVLNDSSLPQRSPGLAQQLVDMSATKSIFSVNREAFDKTFTEETESKKRAFLTRSMATWGVPLDKTEMR